MKLKDIFKNIEIIEYKGDLEKEIKNISSNSKEIQENDLFIIFQLIYALERNAIDYENII